MKSVFYITLLLLCSFCAPKKKKIFQREDTVIVLNDRNFNKTIHHFKNLLVLFYASWCGHCKEFLPTYTKASIALYKQSPRINLAKIEMSLNGVTQKKYDIHSYPTVKFFKDGIPYNYTGSMNEAGIIMWMKKKTLPTISELYTLSDISNFKNTHEVSVIYFGNNTEHLKYLYEIALEDADNFYGKCDFATAYSTYYVQYNTLVLFKKFGEERTELSGKITKDGINRFIEKYSINKLLTFNERTARIVWKDKQPGLFLFRDPNGRKSDKYDHIFKVLSEKLFDRIKVVIASIYTIEEQELNGLTNVKPGDLPTVRIYDARKKMNAYYVMKGEITEQNVLKFVDDWEKGKLKEAMKSEDIIKHQKGKVYEIVGQSFDKDVMENDLNVLVMFYTPYLDTYKKFMPVYEEIAVKFKEEKELNMRVGMIDLSRNEVALSEKVNSYPTLRLYIKGQKDKSVEFKGEKNYDEVVKFVYSNLGVDIEAEEKKEEIEGNLKLDESDL